MRKPNMWLIGKDEGGYRSMFGLRLLELKVEVKTKRNVRRLMAQAGGCRT